MTFPRSIRTVLAVALFGLVQFGLVADARAGLPSASDASGRTRSLMPERSAACRKFKAVHRVVVARDPQHDR